MKKALIFCLALVTVVGAIAQSKKDLEAQIAKLKAEIEQMKPKPVAIQSEVEKASYGLGVLMAGNLKRQGGDSVLTEQIFEGFRDVYLNKTPKISEQDAAMIVQTYMQAAYMKKMAKVKDAGIAFLNENKTKEGVKVTASGLQYKILKSGTGKKPQLTDRATVHYTGTLIDGFEFDSSVRKGTPATFSLTGVVPGWTEVLQLMSEGDKWLVYLPYDLGYGERGNPSAQIPPYSPLIFEMELIKVN